MLNCKYIIRTPGGVKIEIPADFGRVELTDDIALNLLKQYNETTSTTEKKTILAKIVNHIKESTNINNINREDILNIINLNIDEKNVEKKNKKIIRDINDYIEERANYNDFYKALRNYLIKHPEEYSNILDKIDKRPLPSDFKKLDTNKIIGSSNLNLEIKRLEQNISNLRTEGMDFTFLNNIKEFLNILKNEKFISANSNILMSFSNQFGLKSININEYSFFKAGNPSSLYLSLFKRIGNTVDINNLNNILRTNKLDQVQTSKEFFDNIFDDAIYPSKFEQLLEDKMNNKVVSEIIKLVSNTITNSDVFYNLNKSIIQNLNPNSYGFNLAQENLLQQQFLQVEKTFNTEYSKEMMKLDAEKFGIFEGSVKDDYYSEMITLDPNIDYLTLVNMINKEKDLLMIRNERIIENITEVYFNPYIITNIFPRPEGIYIEGTYKNSKGEFDYYRKVFKKGESIMIRQREDPKIIYNKNKEVIVNDSTISYHINTKDTSLNDRQTFIKDLAILGDSTDQGIIVGVYPGHLLIKTSDGNIVKQTYSKVKKFNSSRLLEIDESNKNILDNFHYNSYTSIQNVDIISEGDIIEDPTSDIKKKAIVAFANRDNIFIIVGGDKRFIKSISREEFEKSGNRA
ncbi:MAG: hypothetical protein PHX40_01925 [Bacilli bacterium]|nr:hypothetical protein [Bacilli bacterium]